MRHSEEKRADFVYWKRPRHKWFVFAAGLLQLLYLWIIIQDYNQVRDAGILNVYELQSYTLQILNQISLTGVLTVSFFGTFLIGCFARSQTQARRLEVLLLLFFALASGGLTFVFFLHSSNRKGIFWLCMLFLSVAGVVYSFWKSRKK